MHVMTYDNEIDNKDDVQIKAESSFIDPAVKSLVGLKDWILTMLGYPLVTVELNDNQLNICIQNALEKYTKYAYLGADKYLVVDMDCYEPGRGLNLKQFNVQSVKDISLPRDNAFAQGGDLFWGAYSFLGQGSSFMPFNNNSGMPTMGSWVTWHMVNEYFDVVKRCTGSNPDFQYDPITKYLKLMPEPRNHGRHNKMLLTCQVIPPYEVLYGNEYVKKLSLAFAKMLLGTIRKKFGSVQLLGGAQLDTSIGDEGKAEYDSIMENIIRDEGKGQCCFIV